MSKKLALLVLLLGLLGLILHENSTKRPTDLSLTTTGQVEMCLSCHTEEKLDPAHDVKILGCSTCHLGDPMATDKEAAHAGMVINSGDLRVVEKTCAIEGCHGPDAEKVKNSLMATNRGILATLLYYWGEAETQDGDYSVEKLIHSGETSLAIDYYRKLCASCHLWKERGEVEGMPDLPQYYKEKGGGCTACHRIMPEGKEDADPKKVHPLLTKKVPTSHCVRCHNRSGRLGTSYMGQYESEQYGTPFEDGEPSSKQMEDGRFFLTLEDDIHHRKNMACIDCHTRDEIMGDGKNHAHYEDALEIKCVSCHSDQPGKTKKNNPLNNVAKQDGKFILTGKLDDKKHPLNPPKSGICDYPLHKRLSCSSCHSSWVPQCYGCHVKRDMTDTHLDKLTMKETPGWWEEGRSYIRYERPMLGVWQDKVVIVTPGCQDIVTLINEEGEIADTFNIFTMAALNPHTTQAKGRTCVDCHASTKTVGLGEGTVWRENGTWQFSSIHQGIETPTGQTPPLDSYVDIEGNPLQRSSRSDLRPFNGEELRRILRIGLCLKCHTKYDDPAYAVENRGKKCPVFREE